MAVVDPSRTDSSTDSTSSSTDSASLLGFTERYRAIAARDTRFDGQFFTAVRSTGIYCRPSCPARTPKAENVTFYLTSAAAHDAGFRACKRCLPEAAPGTPAWDQRHDAAARAMRLIVDGVVDRDGVDGLATRLGYSTRQVHRLLTTELGAGPLALARAQRAQTARALIVGTDMPLSDVAFAAGFGSIRQFNDTVSEVFDLTPTALRARRRPWMKPVTTTGVTTGMTTAGAVANGDARTRVDLALPVREPFDARGTLAFLAARAVAGVERADLDGPVLRYARTLRLPHGPGAAEIVVEPGPRGRPTTTARSRQAPGGARTGRVRVRLELASAADVPVAVARLRRMLDLDADPAGVDAALRADAALAPTVAATPGIRVPGTVDPHELVVRAIVGQQISVAAARTHLGRMTAAVGTPYASEIPGLTHLFPTAEQVADGGAEHLRLPARSRATVTAAARALADGDLAVHVGAEPAALHDALVARPGIGPWTAAYVAMRVLGDPDAWLAGDVALLAGAVGVGIELPDGPRAARSRALAAHAVRWAPWRSYAAMHLWRQA